METETDDAGTRRYHHGNLREALVQAALEILEQDGAALTLRATAKAVGVSHTAPYNHFPDKDALMAAIAIRGFDDLRTTTEDARRLAGGSPGDALFATGLAYILFGAEHPALYRLMFGPRKATELTAEVGAAGLAAFEVLVSVMKDGMVCGAFRASDPRAAAFTAWALVHGMTQLALDRSGPLTPEDRAGIETRLRAAHDIMMDGLRPR